jgi:hypothetical protein
MSLEINSKHILDTKSNQVNTLERLYDPEAELVHKLNFFNSYVEITENNKKLTNSIYSLKLPPHQIGLRKQESQENLNLPYVSLRKSSKF